VFFGFETTGVGMRVAVLRAPGLWRPDLRRHDLGVRGREVIRNRVELGPETPSGRHQHPGDEIIYGVDGSLEHRIDGHPARRYNAGEVPMLPAETVDSVRNVGAGRAAELATYLTEKGKPFLVGVDRTTRRAAQPRRGHVFHRR
jgi:quercetin dioxygenase-like cupin family protein